MFQNNNIQMMPVAFDLYEDGEEYTWLSGNMRTLVPPARSRAEAIRALKSQYIVLHVFPQETTDGEV